MTEAFARINPRGSASEARPVLLALPSGTPLEMPEADIHPDDRSLIEWPKARAWCRSHCAISRRGLWRYLSVLEWAGVYLATIAMDYYDPELLAFWSDILVGEAFHLIGVFDAGAGPQRLALYMVPPKAYLQDGTSHTRAHLCRLTNGTCEPVPGAVAHYLGTETPPHRRRSRHTVACPGSGWTTRRRPAPHGTRCHVLSSRPLDVLERPAACGGPARYHRLAYSTARRTLGKPPSLMGQVWPLRSR